jgi:hypothetical protein
MFWNQFAISPLKVRDFATLTFVLQSPMHATSGASLQTSFFFLPIQYHHQMLQKFCSSLVQASVFIKKLTLVSTSWAWKKRQWPSSRDHQGSTFARRQSHSPSELPERFRGWEVSMGWIKPWWHSTFLKHFYYDMLPSINKILKQLPGVCKLQIY